MATNLLMPMILAGSLTAGCAVQNTAPAPEPLSPALAAHDQARIEQSKSDSNQIIGTRVAGSPFAKLQIGMTLSQVSSLIGGGDDQNHYPTGKGWIPFYFGSDAQRIEILYKNQGCLTFTGGNAFGGGSNELIRIEVDATGHCFKS